MLPPYSSRNHTAKRMDEDRPAQGCTWLRRRKQSRLLIYSCLLVRLIMLRSTAAFTIARSFCAPLVRSVSSSASSPLLTPLDTPLYARGALQKGHSLIHSKGAMAHKVLVPIAEDSEELEAVAIIDTLRRAGCEVTVASVGSSPEVRMSRRVRIVADRLISAVENEDFDMIAVPGGMPGAEHCRDCPVLTKLLKKQKAEKKWIAAICASPAVVLHSHGLLEKEKAVCYPSFMDKLPPECRGEGRVCVSNKIVTSMGPGTAVDFALKLVEVLAGSEASKKVAAGMIASS